MEYVPALSDTCRTLVTQHFVKTLVALFYKKAVSLCNKRLSQVLRPLGYIVALCNDTCRAFCYLKDKK